MGDSQDCPPQQEAVSVQMDINNDLDVDRYDYSRPGIPEHINFWKMALNFCTVEPCCVSACRYHCEEGWKAIYKKKVGFLLVLAVGWIGLLYYCTNIFTCIKSTNYALKEVPIQAQRNP